MHVEEKREKDLMTQGVHECVHVETLLIARLPINEFRKKIGKFRKKPKLVGTTELDGIVQK